MKRKYRIKKIFENIRFILKSCGEAASRFTSKLVDIDGFDSYNSKKLKHNNYENYRFEISLQMLKDKSRF